MQPNNHFCGQTRREFFWQSGAGFTSLALTGLLSKEGFFDRSAQAAEATAPNLNLANPLAPKPPHFTPKA